MNNTSRKYNYKSNLSDGSVMWSRIIDVMGEIGNILFGSNYGGKDY
jgi:hypothetical protein